MGGVDPLQVVEDVRVAVACGEGDREQVATRARSEDRREHGRPEVGSEGGREETTNELVCVQCMHNPWTMGC